MMSFDSTLNHLLTVLEDHNLGISRDEVQQGFGDQDFEGLATWIEEFLDHKTLLSTDEAAL